jgi:hypothetical protein
MYSSRVCYKTIDLEFVVAFPIVFFLSFITWVNCGLLWTLYSIIVTTVISMRMSFRHHYLLRRMKGLYMSRSCMKFTALLSRLIVDYFENSVLRTAVGTFVS